MSRASKPLLRFGPANTWLPAVAIFLCLSLFGMAALALRGVATDPKSPESASVTSVAAQGYQGLRRLLDLRGVTTLSNRFEDGPSVTRGDLEIITLDAPDGRFAAASTRGVSGDAASSSESSSGEVASSEESSASARPPELPPALRDRLGLSVKKSRADHILRHPLGRAVLVVAPKWRAGYYPGKPRWAGEAKPAGNGDVRDSLTMLSPMREVPTRYDSDGEALKPDLGPDEDWQAGDETTTIFHRLDYTVSHGGWDLEPVALKDSGGHVVATGKVAYLQAISGANLTPVLTGPHGEVVLARLNTPATAAPVYLLSDPDLLNNQILADPERVVAALDLIDQVLPPAQGTERSIVFNLTFNGMAFDRDLMHALSRPPYLGIPLSVLILGLGLMWASFARFGPAHQPVAEAPLGRGVRVLADNAARLMSLTLRETRLAPAYATLMRDAVLRRRGGSQNLNGLKGRGGVAQPSDAGAGLDDLADRIGAMCRTTNSFADLRRQAASVATVHQLVDLTRKLHAWKTEIERAHI